MALCLNYARLRSLHSECKENDDMEEHISHVYDDFEYRTPDMNIKRQWFPKRWWILNKIRLFYGESALEFLNSSLYVDWLNVYYSISIRLYEQIVIAPKGVFSLPGVQMVGICIEKMKTILVQLEQLNRESDWISPEIHTEWMTERRMISTKWTDDQFPQINKH